MISRRRLVLASAIVAGGVAIGYRAMPRGNLPRKLPDSIPLAPGEVALTPYVVVDARGIAIIAPRAEMGQGIHTTLAALVAEELDVELAAVRVIHGPASEHYANEFMFGKRKFPDRVHRKPAQATIAQSSIRDAFVKMRRAGAAARHVLIQAAAARLGLEPDTLRTASGVVIAPDGQRLSYESLAEQASTSPVPQDLPLKPTAEWRLLGRSLPRVDMVAKCTGTAEYAMDVALPNLVFAAVKRNPSIDAPVVSMDASKAERMRGVERVVPIRDGAIVIATNTWYAMQAAERIQFEWASADYPDHIDGHREELQRALDREPYFVALDRGNVEAAPGPSAVTITGAYSVPYLSHATMEPLNATAWYREGRLDVWAGNQAPTLARRVAMRASGLERDQVHVHTTYMGGGFGRRFELYEVKEAVIAAMAMKGRPVRLTYSREEDLTHDAYRPMAAAEFRASVRDGVPVMLDLKLSSASLYGSGRRREHIVLNEPDKGTPRKDTHITMGATEQPYRISNHRVRAYLAERPLPVGWWRSVGESQNAYFMESIVDEIAVASGSDPLEMRLSMLEHEPSRAVLNAVAELSDWGRKLPRGHGRGLAYCLSSDAATAQIVEVRADREGVRLVRAWAAVDVGIALDPGNLESQVQGSLMFGLSAAIFGEVNVADGAVQERNFDTYPLLQMHHAPHVDVAILESGEEIFGAGECATATAAPALGNAIFAATGRRIRDLPFRRHVRFV